MSNQSNFETLSYAISRIEHFLGLSDSTDISTIVGQLKALSKDQFRIFSFESTINDKEYLVQHDLNDLTPSCSVWVYDNGKWEMELVDIQIIDQNNLKISLCEKLKIKAIIISGPEE